MRLASGPKRRQGLQAMGLALLLGIGALTAARAEGPVPAPGPAGVLTLNQDRLINESAYGRAIAGKIDEAVRALQAENRALDSQLEAEEKALTDERARLSPEAFRQKAAAFDAKVEKIRAEQDAKGRALSDEGEAARRKILQTAAPILAQIMAERGAVAILDRSQVVVSFDEADITSEAIARLDAALQGGAAPGEAPKPPTPAPTLAPPPPEPAAAPVTPPPAAAPVSAPASEPVADVAAPLTPSELAESLKSRPGPLTNPKIDYKALALAARGPRPRANPKTQGP